MAFELRKGSDTISDNDPSVKGRKRAKKKKSNVETQTIEIQLFQDKTALRSRKGDTGSVVWKARCILFPLYLNDLDSMMANGMVSIELAQTLLQQYHAKMPEALFDPVSLNGSHLLELG